MNTSDDRVRGDGPAMPEMAGALSLFAHPMAFMGAAGAIGFGLWLGTMAGMAQATQRLLGERTDAQPVRRGARLRLVETTPARDDLKRISGIGPKLEKVLNDLGIRTYAHVAALDEAKIASLDEQLGFSGRIVRDDWTGQAKRLSGGV